MEKHIMLSLFLTVAALHAPFAQEFLFSGEIKTGVYWEARQLGGEKAKQLMEMGNTDDAGGFNPAIGMTGIPGRFRLDLEFKPISTMGFRVRFEDMKFNNSQISWPFSYGYGNFLNGQLKISAGNLGESPWATGGPEIWSAIDERPGIRTEYKPGFVPGLNVGFVLNSWDYMLNKTKFEPDFANYMQETVFAVAYTHDIFALRFAWRLDGQDEDNLQGADGQRMVYRVEEKIVGKYVHGFSIWANGLWDGLVNGQDSMKRYQNWLYVAYSNFNIDAQMRIGYELANPSVNDFNKKLLTIKPIFFYMVTPMMSAGFSFTFSKDFGVIAKDLDFTIMSIEPQVKVTFNQNAYVAFVYGYQQIPRTDVLEQAHYINIRLVYSF